MASRRYKISPMKQLRFTRDGSDSLENLIEQTCQEIAQELKKIVAPAQFQALLLAGGYGRGEGGVLSTSNGDAPYNDLEFFLLIQGSPRWNERRYSAEIHILEKKMTEKIGIEVEFKILSLEKLILSPTSMFYYDLVTGHRVIAGSVNLLGDCKHHADAARIPNHEATRLLLNRCGGLLFAAHRFRKVEMMREDLDFIARNIAKSQLAMGDAILATMGQYHWSCIERNQRLTALRKDGLPMDEIGKFHELGVLFKLRPSLSSWNKEELKKLHQDVTQLAWDVWKWIEEQRLGRAVESPVSYLNISNKCPETSPMKNALIRGKCFGMKGLLPPSTFHYPRQSLMNSLAILLWSPELFDQKKAWLSHQLVSPIDSWDDAIAAYQELWHRFG